MITFATFQHIARQDLLSSFHAHLGRDLYVSKWSPVIVDNDGFRVDVCDTQEGNTPIATVAYDYKTGHWITYRF